MSESIEPQGELVLRTLAMPAGTNANGDIFGGWIMSQMDIAGGILAKEIADGRTVTVAVDGMKFLRPVKVGDVVCCYGNVQRIGNTSMSLHLEVWVKPIPSRHRIAGHAIQSDRGKLYVCRDRRSWQQTPCAPSRRPNRILRQLPVASGAVATLGW